VPLDRSGVFLAKALANLLFIAGVELVLIPFFTLLFGVAIADTWPVFATIVLLVDLGFVAVGTLYASVAAQTRSKELILLVLALPVLVPAFIAAVALTGDAFLGSGFSVVAARGWFGILIAFDVSFVAVGILAFDFVID
jgi:heme exporter protein B